MLKKLPAALLCFPRRLLSVSRLLGSMEPAVVRCVAGEPRLTISFSMAGSQKHMQREQDEPLGKVLSRIACNLAKGQSQAKKTKRKERQQPSESPELAVVKLLVDGGEVEDTVVNSEAWRDGAVLRVGDVEYLVSRNSPAFTTAELPVSLLAGFPVCPKLEVEFGDLQDCEFLWFKEQVPNISAQTSGDAAVEDMAWTEVGRARVYVPTNRDIGCRLKLCCTAKDGRRRGQLKELVSASAIEAGPGVCTFDTRHAYTAKQVDWPSVRVVSYNILADIYAQTELSKTVLYPYCAPYAMQLDYRQNLIKKELAGYHADIVCLQEVDKGVFLDSLTPALDAFGLDGVFRVKEKQHEGLATFYRRTKLKLLSRHDIMLSEALTSDPIHGELLEKVSANNSLKDKMVKRSTTLQVSILEDLSQAGRKVCVANTHLYWHPQGGNVRLVQMGVAMRHLSHVMEEVAPGAPLVFCGDFNSSPTSGVLQLVTEATVPQQHEDWSSSGPEESCPMELPSTLPPLLSACGPLAYTNYVGGFQGCLDYIFIQPERMQVEQVIPLPSHEEVTTHTALPSVAHPSDHIALVCDLRWNP
ncbi:2',5'-phosphodiesterase 12-like [Entelurus aequoreus]|uniref:2',5'-phosphodiesterase 12-like n=1 Tax=Entelurus aequoreus TaxID=161455 RepID=UPI002B1DDE08|nr:2',5'-phosphodiesterase 12-like [Entelurus aequoreus]XP_061893686.1 2',5'-phosphodiesterase 12-like [Entelurus aequoreus]